MVSDMQPGAAAARHPKLNVSPRHALPTRHVTTGRDLTLLTTGYLTNNIHNHNHNHHNNHNTIDIHTNTNTNNNTNTINTYDYEYY